MASNQDLAMITYANPSTRRSIARSCFSSLRKRFVRFVREWNLFSDHPIWTPSLTLHEQRVATRIFVILLLASLIGLVFYTGLTRRTHEKTSNKFSLADFERLHARYPTSIHVPCTQLSIPLDQLMNFSPKFHQICSSPFVGPRWISSLFLPNATSHNILDARTFAFAQFRALALLCRIARQAIRDTERSLHFDSLVTTTLLSRAQFDEISSVMMNNLQLNVLAEEKQRVYLVSLLIAQNRLMSALRTNYYIKSKAGSKGYEVFNGVYQSSNGTICDCGIERNQCVSPAGLFYNWTVAEPGEPAKNFPPPKFQIPGWMAGCIPLDSTRKSTLECFYNQSCIDQFRSISSSKMRPKALDISQTRFPLNMTIGELFDQALFIESWNHSWSFENYFRACRAKSLSYTYSRRFHLPWMLATCLSAYGGLVMIWLLIVPVLLKIWTCLRSEPKESEEQLRNKPINQVVVKHVHRTIYNFNLFRSENCDDPEEERVGILATRLYIVLLAFGLFVLGIYTLAMNRPQIRTVHFPSLSTFEELSADYSSSLTCPCSQYSMPYGKIMSISAHFHQICSSEFLDEHWLSYFGRVENDVNEVNFLSLDFRVLGQSFFDLTRLFCQTSNETISNARRVFESTRLFTVNTLSRDQFLLETQTRLRSFQQQTIGSYLNLIEFIRESIQNNHLVNEIWTSVGPLSEYNEETSKWSLRFRPRNYYTNSCSCAISSRCTRPVGFYPQKSSVYRDPNITVPGLMIGCYPINSYLSSTLECLYNQTCLQLIIDYYYFGVEGLVRPLSPEARAVRALEQGNSRFPPNTSLETLVTELYVEEWQTTENFSAYYHRCAPQKCTYTVQKRFDKAYMLAMMLGFYGGLASILEIFLPPLVKHIRTYWKKRRSAEEPPASSSTVESAAEPPTSPQTSPDRKREKSLWTELRTLNLFSTPQGTHDEIIATRIYLILFGLCLVAASLYAGPFNTEKKTTVIKTPSPEIVNELHRRNISTLSCPCSTAAINYSTFLSITPRFHPICSSELMNDSLWLEIFERGDNVSIVLSAHYRLLASFCQRAEQFIANAQTTFYSKELITKEAMTEDSFFNQIETLVVTFIDHIPAHFRRILALTIGSFQVNQLLTRFTGNWKIAFGDEAKHYLVETIPRDYAPSNCSCAVSSKCLDRLGSNVSSGCLPFDGFRQFRVDDLLMENLTQNLFILQWDNQSNYTAYFQACQPIECQYTLPDRNNLFYMLTVLVGLYGGLTYTLQTIIDRGLYSYRWWQRHRQ